MRYFNTAGHCRPAEHYMLPPEARLPEARRLVEQGHYFVVHAPRQTGKTTLLASLARSLLAAGEYVALRFSCETGEVAGDDYAAAQRAVLGAIRRSAQAAGLPDELMPPDPWPEAGPEDRLLVGLRAWAQQCPNPLVLFFDEFDEIDALRGEGLRSVLRQLRDGYTDRPAPFPHSVVLCGLRDVRDYRAAARGDRPSLGTASPFNIKIASLRIGDFSEAEVRQLYGQLLRAGPGVDRAGKPGAGGEPDLPGGDPAGARRAYRGNGAGRPAQLRAFRWPAGLSPAAGRVRRVLARAR